MVRLVCVVVMILVAAGSRAQFHDPELLTGSVRTEYPQGLGTGGSFLTLNYQAGLGTPEGCLWPADLATTFGCPGRAGLPNLPSGRPVWLGTIQQQIACRGDQTRIGDSWVGCLSYTASPYYEINSPGQSFWVISANNDPAFDQCRGGPPNNSQQVVPIGAGGLFKVGVGGAEGSASGKRMRMEINATEHSFFCPLISGYPEAIPYLSVGLVQSKGNLGLAPASFSLSTNPGGEVLEYLEFSGRLELLNQFSCPNSACGGSPCFCSGAGGERSGVHGGLFFVSRWAGKPRALYIDLLGEGVLDSSPSTPFRALFNWPIQDSIYFPGADIVFLAARSIQEDCGFSIPELTTQERLYGIDLNRVFSCVANQFEVPPPQSGIMAVEQVHWFVESYGTAGAVRFGFESANVHPQFRSGFE